MLTLLSPIRYMSQAKHAEARELMYNGALLFFSYNQVHAARDFCLAGASGHGDTPHRGICICCLPLYNWNARVAFTSLSFTSETAHIGLKRLYRGHLFMGQSAEKLLLMSDYCGLNCIQTFFFQRSNTDAAHVNTFSGFHTEIRF